ncbi:unnamed protein product [Polarella glacialis]|uniref:Uncharacterized protein n=1 Tax=Polarella glacialis TaxID=89957 RepID=A0A813LU09_POLGL|nr:unnamed protein product [Polarella glacialis]
MFSCFGTWLLLLLLLFSCFGTWLLVRQGFRREGTAASCGPATFLPVSRLQKHQRPLCWRTPVLLRSRPAAALPKKQTPAMTGITCGADYSDLNLPLMQAACGDDTPCMSSPTLLLPQRGQAPQQPDFQLLIQRPQLLSFAAHWQSGLHVTTKSEATCQGSARHARAEERSVLPSCCMLSLVDRVLATTPHSKVHHRATYSWNIELHMRSSCSGQQQQTPLGAEPSAILPCICIPKQAARTRLPKRLLYKNQTTLRLPKAPCYNKHNIAINSEAQNAFLQQTNNTANNNKPKTKQILNSNVVFCGHLCLWQPLNNKQITLQNNNNKTFIT